MTNYILAYYQAIVDGTVTVGRWIRLWYEHVVHGIESGLYTYDARKAGKAIRFIETFCHHSKGRSDLLKLELWQKALISVIFGVLDKDGLRQFREVVIVVARKNGKSLLAAAIVAYMTYADGEYGAEIYCIAPKLEQARLVYDAYYQMVLAEPELSALTKKRRSDTYVPELNTSVKPIPFNSRTSDGLGPHLAIADEVASWRGDPGLKQYEVIKSALGARRQPMVVAITTAGYESDGIYDELIKRSTSVLLGTSEEHRLAPFLYIIDEPEKWDDINELQKSCPNLGVSVSVDYLLEEIAVAHGSISKALEFKTKICNLKQSSAQAWLDYDVVDAASGDEYSLEDFRGCYCVAGIDLSQSVDLSSSCIVVERAGKLYVFSRFWMPRARIEIAQADEGVPYDAFIRRGWLDPSGDGYVDYKDCFAWLTSLVQDYEIYPLVIGYDRYSAQYLVQDLKAYGFKTDDVRQGFNLSPVIDETEGKLKDGKIRIGTNGLLKSHLLNSATKLDTEARKRMLIKIRKRAHIDGAAALLDAMCVRQKWYDELGAQLRNEE